MIKKFYTYIKENHLDLDPYGEDWEDDNLSPILRIAKQQNKPYDQITHLDCSDNQLTSLEGIENLTNLIHLYCYNNQLTSLDGIENLTSLTTLSCYNNQLTSLSGIENLTNLTYLDCYNNQLTYEYKKYLKTLKIKNLYL